MHRPAVFGEHLRQLTLAEAITHASEQDLCKIYELLEPNGTVAARIDPNIAFGDAYSLSSPLWSLLYMGGYVTTDDTSYPEDPDRRRPLRIPNREVASAYRRDVVLRTAKIAGGMDRLDDLHDALVSGNASVAERELAAIATHSASYFDLTNETACHMLVLGLLFGIAGYKDPVSNREAGFGRFDIQVLPWDEIGPGANRPVITVEIKFMAPSAYEGLGDKAPDALRQLAREGLEQIARMEYDGGRFALRWSVAFAGKHVAVVCERVGEPVP